jgi:hypothetical protein
MSKKTKNKKTIKAKIALAGAIALGVTASSVGIAYGVSPDFRDTINSAFGVNTDVSLTPPKAPQIDAKKTQIRATEIIIEQIENGEYSLNEQLWQTSSKFVGLEPGTTYHISVRIKQIGATPAGEITTLDVTTAKYSTVGSPNFGNAQIEPDRITINNSDSSIEYSIDNGVTWQNGTTFSDLQPNTTYTIYARYAETTSSYPSEPTIIEYTTPKYTQSDVPVIDDFKLSIMADTIVLPAIEGCEYSINNGTTWQSNMIFNNLTPGTEYTVYIRYTENDRFYASNYSSITVTTNKASRSAPIFSEPTINGNSVTFVDNPDIEYSIDGGVTWQTSGVFNNLEYNTSITILARYAEDSQHYASDSVRLDITIGKEPQNTPQISVSEVTTNSIVINLPAGAEWSLDKQNWSVSAVVDNLDYNTNYTIYARYAETDTKLASDIISITATTLDKEEQEAQNWWTTSFSESTNDYIEMQSISGVEYAYLTEAEANATQDVWTDVNAIPKSKWTTQTKLTNLQANTNYYVYSRYAENASQKASLPRLWVHSAGATKKVVNDLLYVVDCSANTAKSSIYYGNGGVINILGNVTINNVTYPVQTLGALYEGMVPDAKSQIEEISVPETITSVAWSSAGLRGLKKLTINSNLPSVGDLTEPYVFFNAGADVGGFELVVGASVTSIPKRFLYTTNNLRKITFLNEKTLTINAGSFRFCQNLEELDFPVSGVHLNGDVFTNCPNLKKITFNGGINTVGPSYDSSAFKDCSKLTTIVLNWPADKESRLYQGSESCFVHLEGESYIRESCNFSAIPGLQTIYITDELLETAKTDYFLKNYAEKLKPLSEYSQ